jgi:regulatory protein
MPDVLVLSLDKKPRSRHFEVRLEDLPPLAVTPEVAVQFGLRPGLILTTERFDALREAQASENTMAAALRLVAYRPRTEKELRERLRQRRIAAEHIDSTLRRLRQLGLLNDAAFAASWVESRTASSPRSRRMLLSELRGKGVSREFAESASAAVDEADAAYRAGAKRASVLATRPYPEFQRKIGDLLLRRGFSYEIASEAMRRLWEDVSPPGTNATPNL